MQKKYKIYNFWRLNNKGVTIGVAIVTVFFAFVVIVGLALFENNFFDYPQVNKPVTSSENEVNINKVEPETSAVSVKINTHRTTSLTQTQTKTPDKLKPEQIKPQVIEETTIEKTVLAPGPMQVVAKISVSGSSLTSAGVITWTNLNREQNGKPPLVQNTLLDKAAKIKLDDMFAGQYFEHNAPNGNGPAEVVTMAGYNFLTVGENLALGDFKNDEELVVGWMNSPGHRKNILKTGFIEIGVAVGKGFYEGRETWMAVQEFGTPQSVCNHPNKAVLNVINSIDAVISEKNFELNVRKAELDGMNPRNNPTEYNQKVDEFNALVAEYNNLVAEQKSLSNDYNVQVINFNKCLENYK